MKSKDFEWLTDEFMIYCRSTQLRKKLNSYIRIWQSLKWVLRYILLI